MTKEADVHHLKALLDGHKLGGETLLCGSKLYANSHDRRGWYPSVLGVDIAPGPGVDLVHDLEELLPEPYRTTRFDHVDCCSVLEHVRRPWRVAETIVEAMKPKATLLLSVPFVWRVHGYPSDYWRFTREAVESLFPAIKWEMLKYWADTQYWETTPSKRDARDRVVFLRSEVVGFGRRW